MAKEYGLRRPGSRQVTQPTEFSTACGVGSTSLRNVASRRCISSPRPIPAGIGSNARIWMVPGRLWNARRPQQRPESVTTGMTGRCVRAASASTPGCRGSTLMPQYPACPAGKDHDLALFAHCSVPLTQQTTQRRCSAGAVHRGSLPVSGIQSDRTAGCATTHASACSSSGAPAGQPDDGVER